MTTHSAAERFDLAIVGGGVIGFASAILAARRGLRCILLEADAASLGASIRNFGLITISGQARGPVWELSRRSRDLWESVAREAGIDILQRGMMITAQSEEARWVLDAFGQTEMGARCEPLPAQEAAARLPLLRPDRVKAALWSPHEVRVEPRHVLPRLAAYAAQAGVWVRFGAPVATVDEGELALTSGETIKAETTFICAGAQMRRFAREPLASTLPGVTKLHMLRVRPRPDAGQLNAPVVSDLTLARYPGFADLPEAAALKSRLASEAADMLADGIHIIAVRSADGTVVLGDSHHDGCGDSFDPFQPAEVDARIMHAAKSFLDLEGAEVVERWTGAYPKADGGDWLIEETAPGVWFAGVLGGKGMTLAFGFAEKALARAGLAMPGTQ